MKIGTHDVEIIAYSTGINDNGTKLMEIDVVKRADPEDIEGKDETERVTIYFSQGSSENIRISLEQLKSFGWYKGHPKGLDAIIGAQTTIEIYDDPWEDRNGNARMQRKSRFVRTDRPTQIKSAMAKDAASKWLDSLDKETVRGF